MRNHVTFNIFSYDYYFTKRILLNNHQHYESPFSPAFLTKPHMNFSKKFFNNF